MKTLYSTRLGAHRLAVADLTEVAEGDFYEGSPAGFVLTRINVPHGYRGMGYGSQLLEEVLNDADSEGVRLLLEINPYGERTYEELQAWYEANGFEETEGGVFVRLPQE